MKRFFKKKKERKPQVTKPIVHRFGHFVIPKNYRVTGFAEWKPIHDD
jgi:hypothetical protein